MTTKALCDSLVSGEVALSFLGLHWVRVCAAQDVSPESRAERVGPAVSPGAQALSSPSVGGAKALMISEALGGRRECGEAALGALGLWWV